MPLFIYSVFFFFFWLEQIQFIVEQMNKKCTTLDEKWVSVHVYVIVKNFLLFFAYNLLALLASWPVCDDIRWQSFGLKI